MKIYPPATLNTPYIYIYTAIKNVEVLGLIFTALVIFHLAPINYLRPVFKESFLWVYAFISSRLGKVSS
jgi:hypothetical protein